MASAAAGSLLTERVLRPRHESGIPALGDQAHERLDRPGVVRLEAELMNGHAADPGARVARRALDQRSHDVDGQWLRLAPLAAHRVDGVPANQRGGVAQPRLERFAAPLVGQVVHESDAGGPHPRTAVRRADHEGRDGLGSPPEEIAEGLLPNGPVGGIQGVEAPFIAERDGPRHARNCTSG